MKKKSLELFYQEYEDYTELGSTEQKLVSAAREATESAYAPYSNFQVGAAVLLENGEIVTGNNQENSAYTDGLCAERVALFYANANYKNQPVKAIAVTAQKNGKFIATPIKPCGSCRQALLESQMRYKNRVKIILDGTEKVQIFDGVENLLPFAFDADALNI